MQKKQSKLNTKEIMIPDHMHLETTRTVDKNSAVVSMQYTFKGKIVQYKENMIHS